MASNNNTTPRIIELAAQISSSVAQLEEQLSAQNLPGPSFDEDFAAKYPANVTKLRDQVLDASAELHELLLDPLMLLFKFASISNLVSIDAIARYKIPNMIPAGGLMSFEEIGQNTGLEKNVVRRLLHNAMAMRILKEPEPGMVAHTNISKFLANPAINGWAQFEGRETWPAATRGWVLANNNKTVSEVLSSSPDRAMRFANGMGAIDHVPGYAISLLPTVYNWSSLGNAKIINISGATGQSAIELANAFTNLTFIVQDTPAMIGNNELLTAELKHRITFQEHDLFAPQTEKAPVYFFRMAFRGLSDHFAEQVLRAQIPALESGTKILIQDVVMPEHDAVPLWRERTQRSVDMALQCFSNGRERYLDEWKALLAVADKRFVLEQVHVPEDNLLGILEIVWKA